MLRRITALAVLVPLIAMVGCGGSQTSSTEASGEVPVGSLGPSSSAVETTIATTTLPPSTTEAPVVRTLEERETRMLGMLTKEVRGQLAEYQAHDIDLLDVIGVTAEGDQLHVRWTPDEGVRLSDDARDIRWYSMSKTLNVVWLMTLVEGGVVGLDDPVSTYLPEIPHGDEITLHMLAMHRSGIPPSYDSTETMGSWPSEVDIGADVRAWIATGELNAEPGKGFGYSRIGYAILSWALERASGVAWQDAMRAIAADAGVEITIDEDLAAPGMPNHHPGEGDYRGGGFSAGGISSDISVIAPLFHWVFTEGLSPESVEAMVTADPDMGMFKYAAGLTFSCPCEETDEYMRGSRVGHGGPNAWWEHDLASGATVLFAPTVIADATGWITAVIRPGLHGKLFASLAG
ncbi:MAG: hypothetical protein RLZ04_1379 [Actinomycetota bacterium]|jgi:CubicO group peptidase (beta-lactamase class C family)